MTKGAVHAMTYAIAKTIFSMAFDVIVFHLQYLTTVVDEYRLK